MPERFFDRKVKYFHEIHMGSMTIDAFINRFLDLLHNVPYIKDEKVKIQQFLGCLPPIFLESIEFDMPKKLYTTMHKATLYYEHGHLRQENMNQNIDKSKNFFDNHKPGFNPQPYRKQNNNFPANKDFNKYGTNPYVPTPNGNKVVTSGANATPLQIKFYKCSRPHYVRECKNKTDGVLHNLQEEPTIEDILGTPWIYEALDGRQEDHQATMFEIEGKTLNTYISILIDRNA